MHMLRMSTVLFHGHWGSRTIAETLAMKIVDGTGMETRTVAAPGAHGKHVYLLSFTYFPRDRLLSVSLRTVTSSLSSFNHVSKLQQGCELATGDAAPVFDALCTTTTSKTFPRHTRYLTR